MSSHVYHEIYLHLNWHTKLSRPLLNPDLEDETHLAITERITNTKGVWLHGIGGTETHVHLAINIEPSVTISELAQQLKGGCSHDINCRRTDKVLEWQRGYGVVSFGRNNLSWVLEYIRNQKAHHAAGRTYRKLERISTDEVTGEVLTEDV